MANVSKATRTDDSPVPRDTARGRRHHRWPCESAAVQAVPWQVALLSLPTDTHSWAFDGSLSI